MSDPASARPAGKGLLVVISGPSGVGKTTIVRAVRDRLGGVVSVSATTRPRAAGEQDAVDYYFVTEDRFQEMIDAGELLEHAKVFGRHWYGTPRAPVKDTLAAGRRVLLEIDVQGAIQVRRSSPEALMIFILPPGEDALLARLRDRGRDDEAAIQRRFQEARSEIALARSSGIYDALIVNDNLAAAQDEACALIERRGVAAVPEEGRS